MRQGGGFSVLLFKWALEEEIKQRNKNLDEIIWMKLGTSRLNSNCQSLAGDNW